MTSSHFLSFVTCQEACLSSNLGPRHSLKWHLITTSWHFMTAHTAYYLPQNQSEAKVKIHMTHESWQMDFRWLLSLVHLPCDSRSHDPFERLLWRVSVEVELTVDAMLDLRCRCGTAAKVQHGIQSFLPKGYGKPAWGRQRTFTSSLSFGHVTWFTFGTCFCIWSVTGRNTSDYTLQNADPDSDAVAHGRLLMSGRMAPVAKEEVDCDYSWWWWMCVALLPRMETGAACIFHICCLAIWCSWRMAPVKGRHWLESVRVNPSQAGFYLVAIWLQPGRMPPVEEEEFELSPIQIPYPQQVPSWLVVT